MTASLLARWTLAQRFGGRATDVRLSRDSDGRPRLAAPRAADVSFSVSHTRNLVVCGVSDAAASGLHTADLIRADLGHQLGSRWSSSHK